MFLKTEQFEYNGVSVTLSELSALQRIEHLALLKRRAEQAESSGNRYDRDASQRFRSEREEHHADRGIPAGRRNRQELPCGVSG